MRRVAAILTLRCPRCLTGEMWGGFLTMNQACPVCGFVFEREPGYYTGAMVVSYAIAVPTFGLIVIALLLAGVDAPIALVVGGAIYLALAVFIFRYSRVVWLHLDWGLDPDHKGDTRT